MSYKKIRSYNFGEEELRTIWKEVYCREPIETFDAVKVYFYEEMFDHVFYESSNRVNPDKSILSLNRLEKIYWIRDALKDPEAILKKGWNRKKRKYYKDRRVAIVKGNYVVVIRFVGYLRAKLVTAYVKEDITNILNSPDFIKEEVFFKK